MTSCNGISYQLTMGAHYVDRGGGFMVPLIAKINSRWVDPLLDEMVKV